MKPVTPQPAGGGKANDPAVRRVLPDQTVRLRNQLDVYRWLFGAAVFLAVVLWVAQCAQR